MSVANPSTGVYTAAVSRLPYGERLTFSVLASNAAGLGAVPTVKATTLHKPKKKKPKKNAKKRSRVEWTRFDSTEVALTGRYLDHGTAEAIRRLHEML